MWSLVISGVSDITDRSMDYISSINYLNKLNIDLGRSDGTEKGILHLIEHPPNICDVICWVRLFVDYIANEFAICISDDLVYIDLN